MGGRPGRSGGHNRLTPQELLFRGSWNVTRHGPRPAALPRHAQNGSGAAVLLPVVEPVVESVPIWILDGLTTPGRRFVEAYWREYEGWIPPKRVLLREAGLLVDWLDQHRGDEGERQAQRLLVQILTALKE